MSVLVISTPVSAARKKAAKNVEASKDDKNLGSKLAQVLCIQDPITFKKKSVLALFDLYNEVNAICPTFTKELGFFVRSTDVDAHKIDGTMLNTYEIVVVAFSMTDKVNWVKFFEENFLVANISLEVVFGRSFLTLSSVDIDFLD